jgi:orotidine-5'-phosphate decarboxylase
MTDRHFMRLIEAQWAQNKFLCVGLDTDDRKISPSSPDGVRAFNRTIIDATRDIVSAFKLNLAFYEALGADGWGVLKDSVDYIREVSPEAVVIADAKRADIGNTNEGYVRAVFDDLGADAITVHPYLGAEAVGPFLDRAEKGVIVLCRTSNPGSGELQDLQIRGQRLYEYVAQSVSETWNRNGNCGLVVGATYPEDLARVRALAPTMPILVPGIGAQGGDLEKTVKAARDRMIISISRGIIYASSPRDATIEFDAAIRAAL